MRGVIIFKNFTCPDLPKRPAPNILKTDEQKIDLLKRFNYNWQDWNNTGFRDIIPVEERYSEEQIKYFDTLPKDRFKLFGIKRRDDLCGLPLSGHG